ncbi:putative ABC transport system ATP-binding protein [Streptomyces sp. yr375]|uniref:ABC transporter ATP-binding protein n=1 Tax=Streptomyces sp. yr375 TaxID=1761906 RepID=UPI0008D7401B|nr:ABC transporter ATP-binding protein [Streptomyces sp. yr375]SER39280.1 putative ABC transport system ATP-binding protein [Streptomyces sp. yr375]
MYELKGVTKRYTRGKETVHALAGVDLTIPDGDRLVIQGPTGGGKSTLLQMIGALDRPSEGEIVLDGVDLAKLSEARLTKVRSENIGFVFQSFNLIPTLNAQENVETALVPLGVKPKERRERAAEALKSVGLGERLGHLPSEMSGGQQQRVAIARALVKQPKVLLADEPTGNLDESMRDEIMDVLHTLWKEHGLTFIMVTHDSSIAKKAPRVATIRKGKLTVKENAKTP